MRDIKNKITLYAAWEYDKEEKDLNEASKNGLQLVKGGCFHSKFRRDPSVRYIYQLDYNTRIDDVLRYKETFEDQGWEYINSTFNGWHYFRKPYREDMDEQDTRIYTDEQSLMEMQNRWLYLMMFFDAFYLVFGLIYLLTGVMENALMPLIEGILFLTLGAAFLLGIINIKRKRKGKSGSFLLPIQFVLPVALLILIAIPCLGDLSFNRVFKERFSIKTIETEEMDTNVLGKSLLNPSNLVIPKDGKYSLELKCSIVKGGQITITIQDEDGNTVYYVTAGELTHNGILNLKKGKYHVLYEFDLGNNDPADASIDVEIEIRKIIGAFH